MQLHQVIEDILQQKVPFSSAINLNFFRGKNFHALENSIEGTLSSEHSSILPLIYQFFQKRKKTLELGEQNFYHLEHDDTIDGDCFDALEVNLELKDQQSAILLETFTSNGEGSFFKARKLNIKLGQNASLQHLKVINGSLHSALLAEDFIDVKRDARYHAISFATNANQVSLRPQIRLLEENASAILHGAYALNKGESCEVVSMIEHFAPMTKSQQRQKNILNNKSRTFFDGKIVVHPHAQGVVAKQSNNNLILDKLSQAISKPQLMIQHSDVKCNHGATIGSMDENQLFYLTSRGIERKRAEQILTLAYLNEVLTFELKPELLTLIEKELKDLTL